MKERPNLTQFMEQLIRAIKKKKNASAPPTFTKVH